MGSEPTWAICGPGNITGVMFFWVVFSPAGYHSHGLLRGLELVDCVAHYLDSGKLPISIFLDLSKAFDPLNHTILLKKLAYYGLNGTSLDWFRSYLSDRSQYVDYDGTTSISLPLTTGVPQGSILGPLLFIIYMNDIHEASQNYKVILYADDTNLTGPISYFSPPLSTKESDIEVISSNINSELNDIFKNGSA